MALPTLSNPYIRQVERRPLFAGDVDYSPEERAAARSLVDAQTRAKAAMNPSGALAGGAGWADFEQYHQYQRALRGGRGGKHTVSGASIEGGGDRNQRDITGRGPTYQIGGTGAVRPATSPTRAASSPVSAPRGASGGDMYDFLSERPVTAERASVQDLVMRGLRAQIAQQEAAGDMATREADPRWAMGTPNWENRTRATADLSNDLAYDKAITSADAASDAYWRFGRSIDVDKAATAEQTGETEHQRNLELARERGLPTIYAADQRAAASGQTLGQRNLAASIRALQAEIGNARQYGDNDTVAQLQPALDGLIRQATGAGAPAATLPVAGAGRAAGPGAAGAMRDGQTRVRNGRTETYMTNPPDGGAPGWFVFDDE